MAPVFPVHTGRMSECMGLRGQCQPACVLPWPGRAWPRDRDERGFSWLLASSSPDAPGVPGNVHPFQIPGEPASHCLFLGTEGSCVGGGSGARGLPDAGPLTQEPPGHPSQSHQEGEQRGSTTDAARLRSAGGRNGKSRGRPQGRSGGGFRHRGKAGTPAEAWGVRQSARAGASQAGPGEEVPVGAELDRGLLVTWLQAAGLPRDGTNPDPHCEQGPARRGQPVAPAPA